MKGILGGVNCRRGSKSREKELMKTGRCLGAF